MKAICIADVHLHPYRECSRDNGQDRLQDGLSVLRQSLQHARKRHCQWIFLGDLKHLKGMWNLAALNGALALMEEYSDVPKVMVHGNHDGVASGSSGLAPFKKHALVVESPGVYPSGGGKEEKALIWPWQSGLDHLSGFVKIARKERAQILFAHVFLAGSKVGPAEVRLEGTGSSLEDFGLGKKNRMFKWAFLGDVHKQQEVAPRVFYCGSPYGLNWGELEPDKGCLFVDTDRDSVEIIPLQAPQFHVVDLTKTLEDVRRKGWANGDFVRLIVDEAFKQKELEKIHAVSGARYFQVIVHRHAYAEQRVADIHAGMGEKELLKAYMSARPIDGLDGQEVLKAGMALLRG